MQTTIFLHAITDNYGKRHEYARVIEHATSQSRGYCVLLSRLSSEQRRIAKHAAMADATYQVGALGK